MWFPMFIIKIFFTCKFSVDFFKPEPLDFACISGIILPCGCHPWLDSFPYLFIYIFIY